MPGMANERLKRLIVVLLAGVVWTAGLMFVGYNVPSLSNVPNAEQMARDTAALRAVLPVLEEQRVTVYNHAGWCDGITTNRGTWVAPDPQMDCYYDFPESGSSPEAHTTFNRLSDALTATGVSIDVVRAEYASGKVSRASFGLPYSSIDMAYLTYYYAPGATLPTSYKGSHEFTRIDSDWYFEWWSDD
jgi:hypothetical protein